VLVVTDGDADGLPETIHERVARTRAEVLVVAPAKPASTRRWSQPRGRRPAEGIVGDADPAQAIADALALFEADVLVVDGSLADRARRRFGLPIVPVRAAA
jgi:hypothetical protein